MPWLVGDAGVSIAISDCWCETYGMVFGNPPEGILGSPPITVAMTGPPHSVIHL